MQKKVDSTKKTFQEESKALGGMGPGQNFSGTVAGSFIEMKVPDYFCSVVCAGLDIDEVLDDARIKTKTPQLGLNKTFTSMTSPVQEEQDLLNVNLNQVNSVA